MWKTSQRTPATTGGFTTVTSINSGRNQELQQKQPFQFPIVISQNPEYSKLYEKIHKSQAKSFAHILQQQQKQRTSNIKQTITNKIFQHKKSKSFSKKFGKTISYSLRKMIKNQQTNALCTKQQQNNDKLSQFLMDHRKAGELQQHLRLVEYYLGDQEKNRSNVQYLNKLQLLYKHRRATPHQSYKFIQRSAKLFNCSEKNNQQKYHLLRKTAYIRNDKLISMSMGLAKKSPTYRRIMNFQRISYIVNQINHNLIAKRPVIRDQQLQRYHCIKRRIFIHVALVSQALRTYYNYIRQKDFPKLIELILPQSKTQPKLTKQYVQSIIDKIIKYKQNKVLHFQDFVQIVKNVKQEINYDIVESIIQRCVFSNHVPVKTARSSASSRNNTSRVASIGLDNQLNQLPGRNTVKKANSMYKNTDFPQNSNNSNVFKNLIRTQLDQFLQRQNYVNNILQYDISKQLSSIQGPQSSSRELNNTNRNGELQVSDKKQRNMDRSQLLTPKQNKNGQRQVASKLLVYSKQHKSNSSNIYINSSQNSYSNQNLPRSKLQQLIEQNKFHVIVQKIYEKNSKNLVGNQYLPLQYIVQIMKSINIVPKVVTLSKLMHMCYWFQKRREGFNIGQFMLIQVGLGYQMGGSLSSIGQYISMFDIQAIIVN